MTIADWTLIKDAESATRFADRLEAVPRAMISGRGTALVEADRERRRAALRRTPSA